jgi:hypothetical protein
MEPSVTALLMKLNASVSAGITEAQLKGLLMHCSCRLFMTKGSFDVHHCLPNSQNSTVIDLTADDEYLVLGPKLLGISLNCYGVHTLVQYTF